MDAQLWITVIGVVGTLGFHAYKSWLDHTEKVESHLRKIISIISKWSNAFILVASFIGVIWTVATAESPLSKTTFANVLVGIALIFAATITALLGVLAKSLTRIRSAIVETREGTIDAFARQKEELNKALEEHKKLIETIEEQRKLLRASVEEQQDIFTLLFASTDALMDSTTMTIQQHETLNEVAERIKESMAKREFEKLLDRF